MQRSKPVRILHIGFATWHILDVCRLAHCQMDAYRCPYVVKGRGKFDGSSIVVSPRDEFELATYLTKKPIFE